MRLSTSMIYQSGLNGILNSQSALLGLQQQVSSGRRVVTPSDDPLAAGQSITVSQNLAMTKAYASNRVVAERALGVEDNALQAVISNLTNVFERIVQAGDGTLSDPDRRMLASVIGNSRDALFALANTTDGNGQYLFSGYQGGTPAYSVDATGQISYTGDSGQRVVQVDQAREMASTDIGTDIFGRATPGTNTYFISAGANTGTATYGGPATSGTPAQPGSSFKIDFANDGAGNISYTVTTTAADGTVSTSPAASYSPGAAIQMDGVSVAVNGTPADGDSFTLEPAESADLDVFATLEGLRQALLRPAQDDPQAQAALRNALTSASRKISVNLDNVSTVRASVGARQNELEALAATGSQRALTDTKALSDLVDLDYYSAVSAMTLRQVALQASMAAFSAIQGVSLFSTNK